MAFAIFIGGTFPQKQRALPYLASCSTFFVADSGLSICDAYGIAPNLLIGDFDSVDKTLLLRYDAVPQKKFPKDKDFSDTELALKYAAYFATLVDKKDGIEKICTLDDNLILSTNFCGQEELILVGGSGGRIDHLFAIKELFASNLYPNLWLTEENAIYCLEEGFAYKILPAVLNAGNGSAENGLTGNCGAGNGSTENGSAGNCGAGNANFSAGKNCAGKNCADNAKFYAGNCSAENGFAGKNFLDAPISFFCVAKGASGANFTNKNCPCIKSCGLEWELDGVAWQNGFASLSNRAKTYAKSISINVNAGRFLCVLPLGMTCTKV